MSKIYHETRTGARQPKWRASKVCVVDVPHIVGNIIYRLISDNEVKYVGITTNFYARMKRHACKNEFWSEVELIEYYEAESAADMAVFEILLINELNPEWNQLVYSGKSTLKAPLIDWNVLQL